MTKTNAVALGIVLGIASLVCAPGAAAQGAPASKPATSAKPTATAPPTVPAGAVLPPGYVIGADDVLSVLFWRDKDLSGDVVVRPDGRITLPLVNDVQAAGLTPEQLRDALTTAAAKFVEDPNVTVVVKTINSWKVFVTGMVAKPGPYPLSAGMTVMQALTVAGGVHEFAKSKNIIILRKEGGKQASYPFNYKDVAKGKNLQQNIQLKPGDTVIVP